MFLFHPVQVSVCNIEIFTKKQSIEITFQVNTEDLELAIAHNYEKVIHSMEDSTIINKWIDNYIKLCFHIQINNKLLDYKNISVTQNDLYYFIHYEAAMKNKRIKSIEISNHIFMDINFNQKNLVIITKDNTSKGYECNLNNTEISINL